MVQYYWLSFQTLYLLYSVTIKYDLVSGLAKSAYQQYATLHCTIYCKCKK